MKAINDHKTHLIGRVTCFRDGSGLHLDCIYLSSIQLSFLGDRAGYDEIARLLRSHSSGQGTTMLLTGAADHAGLSLVLMPPVTATKDFLWAGERPVSRGGRREMQFYLYGTAAGFTHLAGYFHTGRPGDRLAQGDDLLFPGSATIRIADQVTQLDFAALADSGGHHPDAIFPEDLTYLDLESLDSFDDLDFTREPIFHQLLLAWL